MSGNPSRSMEAGRRRRAKQTGGVTGGIANEMGGQHTREQRSRQAERTQSYRLNDRQRLKQILAAGLGPGSRVEVIHENGTPFQVTLGKFPAEGCRGRPMIGMCNSTLPRIGPRMTVSRLYTLLNNADAFPIEESNLEVK